MRPELVGAWFCFYMLFNMLFNMLFQVEIGHSDIMVLQLIHR